MKWERFRALVAAFGLRAAIGHHLQQRFGLWGGSVDYLHTEPVIYPLCVRRNSSDIEVYRQIFTECEYKCLDDMADARLIIDCGANVGYSSAYFLSRHPTCQVIAIEPDPDNFAMLQRNTAGYGTRVQLIQAGVWSHPARLVMSEDRYRDGREWSKQVRLSKPDERADLEGVDIGSVLAASGHHRISILKVDVEGAEAVIFADNYEAWLDKVDAIAIELHDDSIFGNGSEVFFRAINGQGFQVSHSGELTVCRRPDPTTRCT
ncbi:MAG: FkbM family methyltransferase [Nitrospiraceae bacterium]